MNKPLLILFATLLTGDFTFAKADPGSSGGAPAARSSKVAMGSSEYYAEEAVRIYNMSTTIGLPISALHHYYDNISLSRYYFYLDSGDIANAEFNLYYYKGLAFRYMFMSRGKAKLGRYFQFMNLAQAHRRFWTLRGNPQKGQQLYVKYREIAQLARL